MSKTLTERREDTKSTPAQTLPGEFVFSSWTDLPALEIEHQRSLYRQRPVGFLERFIALLLLILVLPLLLCVVIVMKIESPRGAILYCQERVGLDRRKREGDSDEDSEAWNGEDRRKTPADGQYFDLWKLRTMIPDAEVKTGPVWASEHDPRITRVGSVLRHLRIDELPQLMNVVRGQMGLIGPRPERPYFVHKLANMIPEYRGRLRVRPGITGLAQVEREYDADVDDVRKKLGYDLFYVENQCKILDLKILLKTIDVVLRGRGAH